MDPRLNIVTLGVRNLTRSRKFYCDGLGFRASSASVGDVVFMDAGGVVLALFPRTLLAKDAGVKARGSGFGGITIAWNVKKKSDVDSAIARAKKAGAKILQKPHDAFWGGYTAYFADPDGHPWEVAWNPHFPLDAKGRVRLPR